MSLLDHLEVVRHCCLGIVLHCCWGIEVQILMTNINDCNEISKQPVQICGADLSRYRGAKSVAKNLLSPDGNV